MNKRVFCKDGESISVQANEYAYCTPRSAFGPYVSAECGFPSCRPNEDMMEYCESPEKPLDTVYGYVPADVILQFIEEHGGMESGELPEFMGVRNED